MAAKDPMSSRGRHEKVCEGVFLVGGDRLSGAGDCLVYAIDLGDIVLIDCGCGPGWPRIRDNLRSAGLDPVGLHTLLLTHAHVDHIGAAAAVRAESGCRVVAHALDAPAVRSGDPVRTAANWYGIDLPGVPVDHAIDGDEAVLRFAKRDLRIVHTPGHTPGSVVAIVETDAGRVLFGQDIHGPFDLVFGSDVAAWRRSMEKLLALECDILCEGHFGVFRGKAEVRRFIERHLAMHE